MTDLVRGPRVLRPKQGKDFSSGSRGRVFGASLAVGGLAALNPSKFYCCSDLFSSSRCKSINLSNSWSWCLRPSKPVRSLVCWVLPLFGGSSWAQSQRAVGHRSWQAKSAEHRGSLGASFRVFRGWGPSGSRGGDPWRCEGQGRAAAIPFSRKRPESAGRSGREHHWRTTGAASLETRGWNQPRVGSGNSKLSPNMSKLYICYMFCIYYIICYGDIYSCGYGYYKQLGFRSAQGILSVWWDHQEAEEDVPFVWSSMDFESGRTKLHVPLGWTLELDELVFGTFACAQTYHAWYITACCSILKVTITVL